MTEITKAHAEWAVVDRLRTMVEEKPHANYSVTQSYGLCLAILAWVMQRVQTSESQTTSPQDHAAITLRKKLASQCVESHPWCLKTGEAEGCVHSNKDFKGFTAFNFLKWLRNASCHGDARQVSPLNSDGSLIGFELRVTDRGNQTRVLFLTECDLRRIGVALATMYCHELQSAVSPAPTHFVEDAQSMRERRIAV